MRITVNGETTDVDAEETVLDLLRRIGADPRKAAVVVNEDVVPRARHEEHGLREGDVVEILMFAGGG